MIEKETNKYLSKLYKPNKPYYKMNIEELKSHILICKSFIPSCNKFILSAKSFNPLEFCFCLFKRLIAVLVKLVVIIASHFDTFQEQALLLLPQS